MHSDALAKLAVLEYEPARHGSSADAPSGQKLPPLHGMHEIAPSLSWKEPAAHLLHDPAFDSSLYVPAAQIVALLEPVGLNEPGVVRVHSAALARSVR